MSGFNKCRLAYNLIKEQSTMVSMAPQKRKSQKHQNKTAWQVKFNPKFDDDKKKVKLELMCKRCVDQIMWKLQFGKYKRISEPGRCNICQQKVVVKSYHQVCDPCSKEKDVCSKCIRPNSEIELPDKLPELDKARTARVQDVEDKGMERYLRTMRERSRRTIRRGLQKQTITWNSEQELFLDSEGQPVQGLKFKQADKEEDFEDIPEGEDDDDDEDCDDDDDLDDF